MGFISSKQKPNNEHHSQEIILENVNFKQCWPPKQGVNWGRIFNNQMILLFSILEIVPQKVITAVANLVGVPVFPNLVLISHFLSKACSEQRVEPVPVWCPLESTHGTLGAMSSICGCFYNSQSHFGHPYWFVALGYRPFSGELLEACDHMPAGGSDMAVSCLVRLYRRQILGMDSSDLES